MSAWLLSGDATSLRQKLHVAPGLHPVPKFAPLRSPTKVLVVAVFLLSPSRAGVI